MRVSAPSNLPVNTDGSVDLDAWVAALCRWRGHLDGARIRKALTRLREGFNGSYLQSGMELAELVASMQMDTTSVLAALFYRPGAARRHL